MLELIVMGLFVSFGVLPSIFSSHGMTYKESFIVGNAIVLFVLLVALVVAIVGVSFSYVFNDGLSLYDVTMKIFNYKE